MSMFAAATAAAAAIISDKDEEKRTARVKDERCCGPDYANASIKYIMKSQRAGPYFEADRLKSSFY